MYVWHYEIILRHVSFTMPVLHRLCFISCIFFCISSLALTREELQWRKASTGETRGCSNSELTSTSSRAARGADPQLPAPIWSCFPWRTATRIVTAAGSTTSSPPPRTPSSTSPSLVSVEYFFLVRQFLSRVGIFYLFSSSFSFMIYFFNRSFIFTVKYRNFSFHIIFRLLLRRWLIQGYTLHFCSCCTSCWR